MDAQATNNLIATVGVIISVLAFIVSIRALRAQRRHNELSARPIIDATFGRDDRLIELTNCGLGPALITSIRAQIEDECFDLMQDEGLSRLAQSVAGVLKRETVVTPLRLTTRSPLTPNQSKPLLSLRKPFLEKELDDIRLRLTSVSLTVEYDCIYQKAHVFRHEPA